MDTDGAEGEAGDLPCTGWSADLTDGFYQFRCERMACWFGLDFVMRAAEGPLIF